MGRINSEDECCWFIIWLEEHCEFVTIMANRPCSNSIWSTLRRMSLATAVYYVSHERNSRLMTQDKRGADVLRNGMRKCRFRKEYKQVRWLVSVVSCYGPPNELVGCYRNCFLSLGCEWQMDKWTLAYQRTCLWKLYVVTYD